MVEIDTKEIINMTENEDQNVKVIDPSAILDTIGIVIVIEEVIEIEIMTKETEMTEEEETGRPEGVIDLDPLIAGKEIEIVLLTGNKDSTTV